jgi:hypothetical protein
MTHAVLSSTPTFEMSTSAKARMHKLVPCGAYTYARGSDKYLEDMTTVQVCGHGARVVAAVGGALDVSAQAVEADVTHGLLVDRPVAPSIREFAEPRRLWPAITTGRRGSI